MTIEEDTARANDATSRALEAKKLELLVQKAAADGESQKLPDDPFVGLSAFGVIQQPFDLLALTLMPEQSSELNQCIEAMETNIEATGHRFIPRLTPAMLSPVETDAESKGGKPASDVPAKGAVESPEAKAEKLFLQNFFEYATSESFIAFRRKLRRDLETTGNAYIEVLRLDGKIVGFEHVPSYQVCLGKQETSAHAVSYNRLVVEEADVKIVSDMRYKRFRRFAQTRFSRNAKLASGTAHTVWFKEFGDRRKLSKRDGTFDEIAKQEDEATELIHLRLYSPRGPYGVPRYIGNLLAIVGDRLAEEINYGTFQNNNVPSIAVLVSNGQLTAGSVDRIKEFVSTNQQSKNYSRMLIIEAETAGEDGEDGGATKLALEPLTQNQHKDALFQEYSKNNQDRVRRAFRLPPIFVGKGDDYTRATAETARRLADEEVFGPERDEFDALFNRILFPEMGVRYHKFKSNTPNTTDNERLVKILSGAEKTGGLTPRIARNMLELILGIDLPPFPAGFALDVPFSMTMAEAVKNQADPVEPGQQVTALKRLRLIDELTGSLEESLDGDSDLDNRVAVAKQLMALNRLAEAAWRRAEEAASGG